MVHPSLVLGPSGVVVVGYLAVERHADGFAKVDAPLRFSFPLLRTGFDRQALVQITERVRIVVWRAEQYRLDPFRCGFWSAIGSPSAAANGIVTHPSDMPVAVQRNAVFTSSVVVLIGQLE